MMAKETTSIRKKKQRFTREKDQKWWRYHVIGSDDVVDVAMTLLERMDREDYGYMTLPDGREGKFSVLDQLVIEGSKIRKNGEQGEVGKRVMRPKWPLRTTLSGVDSSQVAELRKRMKDEGVRGTDVHPDGSLEWADARARYDYCRFAGLYDRNAGYSDPAPQNR